MSTTNLLLRRACRWLGQGLAVAGLALAALASHGYTVTLSPASQTVSQGTRVSVEVTAGDVIGSGGLGAYDFIFAFDHRYLSFQSLDVSSILGVTSGDEFLTSTGDELLVFRIFEETDLAALLAQQGDAYSMGRLQATLFTLNFDTVGVGTSSLSFSDGHMSDVSGENEIGLGGMAHNTASITVLENLAVPVPGTLSLVLAAALAGVVSRRGRALPVA
jgi:hypothetical protein